MSKPEEKSQKKPDHDSVMTERRSMIERRKFSYHAHIPERRSGRDRRGQGDRGQDRSPTTSYFLFDPPSPFD